MSKENYCSELFFASRIIASGDTLLNHTCSGGCGLKGGVTVQEFQKVSTLLKRNGVLGDPPLPPSMDKYAFFVLAIGEKVRWEGV